MIFPSSYSPYLSLSNYLFEMNKRRRKILSILHYLSCFPKISKQTIHIPSNCLVLNASFLLFLPPSPLFSCPMSHGRAKDREKERSEKRLAARLRKFIPKGMKGEEKDKTGCDEQAFSRGCARSFFPSPSRVVNSTGFGDH